MRTRCNSKRLSDEWLFVQSCLDCGFIPNQKKVKQHKEKYFSITEVDWGRKDDK